MSRRRAKLLFLPLSAGLLALGCGRDAEPQEPQAARTAGMEEPQVTAEPGAMDEPGGMDEPGAMDTAEPGMATAPTEPTEPTEPEPGVTVQVSDAEVASFADVIIQLAELEQEAAARVDAGQPPEQVTAELQPRVDQVFDGTLLTADRFKEIADQAEGDAALRERIEAQLEERVQQMPA